MSKQKKSHHNFPLDGNGEARTNKTSIRVDINVHFAWQTPAKDKIEEAFRANKEAQAKKVADEYMPVILAAINHRLTQK